MATMGMGEGGRPGGAGPPFLRPGEAPSSPPLLLRHLPGSTGDLSTPALGCPVPRAPLLYPSLPEDGRGGEAPEEEVRA